MMVELLSVCLILDCFEYQNTNRNLLTMSGDEERLMLGEETRFHPPRVSLAHRPIHPSLLALLHSAAPVSRPGSGEGKSVNGKGAKTAFASIRSISTSSRTPRRYPTKPSSLHLALL